MKHAIIVDDERPAIDKFVKMLNQTGRLVIDGVFTDPNEAIAFAGTHKADIAFLDIEMPAMDGFELANRLSGLLGGVHIVFVTAYSEYAVEAFKLNALDYLLKPVEMERLQLALNRIPEEPPADRQEKSAVQVTCFGKFTVAINGEQLKFRTAKAEELFAYLVDSEGKNVHRNHVIDSFWMDYDGDRGMILFNTTLYYLKKAFIQKGAQLKIDYNRGSYQLDMRNIECDAIAFTERMKKLGPVSGETVKEYEDVLALYTNDYFEQNEYGWAVKKRLDLKEKYTNLLFEVFKFYIQEGSTKQAVEILKSGLRRDPLNKVLNYELLKELKRSNDRVALLKYYDIYKKHLESELGMEPDNDCKNLLRQ